MKMIFHIGMGKTGTSSIQYALQHNRDHLARQKVAYLGMCFTMLGQPENQPGSFPEVFARPPEVIAQFVQDFAAYLGDLADQGVEVAILSSESIFAQGRPFVPFLQGLRAHVDVSLVAYLRHPQSWLPSAHAQWGVRHKFYPGPVRSFADLADQLIRQYEGIRLWQENFPDILTVRPYDQVGDVVRDFAETVGIDLPAPDQRELERGEPAELLLHALFNNRRAAPALPQEFISTVINSRNRLPVSLREMRDACFDYSVLPEVIAQNREIFDYIRDHLGLDFTAPPDVGTPGGDIADLPDMDRMQGRLIDYLTEIVLDQARRLRRLERKVRDLSGEE